MGLGSNSRNPLYLNIKARVSERGGSSSLLHPGLCRSLPSKAFQAKVQGIEKGNAEWTTPEPASFCASWQFPGPRRPPSITPPQLCKPCVDHVLLVCRNKATHPNQAPVMPQTPNLTPRKAPKSSYLSSAGPTAETLNPKNPKLQTQVSKKVPAPAFVRSPALIYPLLGPGGQLRV